MVLRLALAALLAAGCGSRQAAPQPPEPDTERPRVVVDPVPSGRITGRVLVPKPSSDAAGRDGERTARGLRVTLQGDDAAPTLEWRIDESGQFFFGPIPPGAYEVAITSEEGEELRRKAVRVDDDETLELVVELTGTRP